MLKWLLHNFVRYRYYSISDCWVGIFDFLCLLHFCPCFISSSRSGPQHPDSKPTIVKHHPAPTASITSWITARLAAARLHLTTLAEAAAVDDCDGFKSVSKVPRACIVLVSYVSEDDEYQSP